jgi:hypothetical protein
LWPFDGWLATHVGDLLPHLLSTADRMGGEADVLSNFRQDFHVLLTVSLVLPIVVVYRPPSSTVLSGNLIVVLLLLRNEKGCLFLF